MCLTLGGVGEKTYPVSLEGIGDPHFLAIDDVVITIPLGCGFNAGHI